MWLVLMFAVHASAADGSYYLETAAAADRTQADNALQAAAAVNCDGRVIRKFVVGQGWRFFFRTTEFSTPQGGGSCLDVSWPAGVKAILMHENDGVVSAVDDVGVRSSPDASSPKQEWSAPEVLRRVARAHGGPHAGATESDDPEQPGAMVFRFQRRTHDGRIIDHVYATRGADVYVQVTIVDGSGISSRFGVVGDAPWMSPKPDDVLDASAVRDQAQRFSPDRVLGVPFRFTQGVPDDKEYAAMRMETPVLRQQRPMQRLLFDGDRSRKPFMLGVDVGTWRIQQVVVGRGATSTVFEMSDYRELDGGLVYPSTVLVKRDAAVLDHVIVQELDFSPTLPDEWFKKGGP